MYAQLFFLLVSLVLLIVSYFSVRESWRLKKQKDFHIKKEPELAHIILLNIIKTEIDGGLFLYELAQKRSIPDNIDPESRKNIEIQDALMRDILLQWKDYRVYANQPISYETYVDFSQYAIQIDLSIIKQLSDFYR